MLGVYGGKITSYRHLAEEAVNRLAQRLPALGGPAWTLRRFFTDGGLLPYLRHDSAVNILTLEDFVARANRGAL